MHLHSINITIFLSFPAPLVKIKQALQKLRAEISQMDIRIGVVNHILLQAKLKEKHESNRSVARAAQEDEDII